MTRSGQSCWTCAQPSLTNTSFLIRTDSTNSKVKAAIWDCAEQLRRTSDPVELGDMAHVANDDGEGKWKEVNAAGRARGKGKAKGKGKPKIPAKGYGKATDQPGGKGPQSGMWGRGDPDYFPHNCGERVCNVLCGKPRG